MSRFQSVQGFPLLVDGALAFCPKNFVGLASMPSECILDLERLNTALAVIDLRFRRQLDDPEYRAERIRLRDLLNRADRSGSCGGGG